MNPIDELCVLLVEDDAAVRKAVTQTLQLAGMSVRAFGDAESAFEGMRRDYRGIVISDIKLPGKDGLALLRQVTAMDREIPVILITGHGDVGMAVEAMRTGAHDFIEKPFRADEFVEVARRALAARRLVLDNRSLRRQLLRKENALLVGDSPAIARIHDLIRSLGPTNADILINGETGTGKEVVARALHFASERAGEFVAINCGALPETVFESEILGHEAGAFTGAVKRRVGKIEHANHGTLFLDEIESMPLAMQVKLLRVLQERRVERLGGNELIPVDCRVIAASKANLRALSDEGGFRADLYYRLNVISIDLPPLRRRREDIPALVAHFLEEARNRYLKPRRDIAPEQMSQWLAQDWPGNIRELRNAVDRYVLGVPQEGPCEAAPARPESLPARLDLVERALIEEELRRGGGNVARAAQALDIPKKTLYDKLQKHGLVAEQFRSEDREADARAAPH